MTSPWAELPAAPIKDFGTTPDGDERPAHAAVGRFDSRGILRLRLGQSCRRLQSKISARRLTGNERPVHAAAERFNSRGILRLRLGQSCRWLQSKISVRRLTGTNAPSMRLPNVLIAAGFCGFALGGTRLEALSGGGLTRKPAFTDVKLFGNLPRTERFAFPGASPRIKGNPS